MLEVRRLCRMRMNNRMLADEEWQLSVLPPFLQRFGSWSLLLTRSTILSIRHKYPHSDDVETTRRVLRDVRTALGGKKQRYLLGQFTFAGAHGMSGLQ